MYRRSGKLLPLIALCLAAVSIIGTRAAADPPPPATPAAAEAPAAEAEVAEAPEVEPPAEAPEAEAPTAEAPEAEAPGVEPPQPDVTEEPAPAEAPEPAQDSEPVPEGLQVVNLSYPPGLKSLTGINGYDLARPITVQVLDGGQPAAGRTVEFMLLSSPSKAEGQILDRTTVVTDAEGRASTGLTLGDSAGSYVIGAFLDGNVEVEPARIKVDGRRGTWVMFLVFGLLGGLGLFLMGMESASDGLQEAAGDRMRGILSALTSNRVLGLIIGIVATAVLQSSSATTVMLVGFVSAGMMNLAQAIGVTMGAKIGTTITAQLIAFNIAEYSTALIAGGFIMRVVGRRKIIRQLGVVILGFGLIFFGLGVMGDAMRPLRTVPAFTELLVSLGDAPLLGIGVAVAFTAIVQSSAATIGLAIALCASGLLSLEAALPLAWGAHIGTCATALLSSLGAGREGKQVAIAHLIFSVAGVAVAFPFLAYFIDGAKWVTEAMGSSSVARELANGHMLFTIATGIVGLPFLGAIAWATEKIIASPKQEPPFGPKYINEASLGVPVLALDMAKREILRQGQLVKGMLARGIELLEKPEVDGVQAMARDDDKVDILDKAIRAYLAQVGQRELSDDNAAREHAYIYLCVWLESIGDILNTEVAKTATKLEDRGLAFSEEGLGELRRYHGKVVDKLDRVLTAIDSGDRSMAEQTLQLSFKERMMERRLRDAHLERLHSGKVASVETSSLHLGTLNDLRAITDKLDDMARIIMEKL